MFSISDFLRLRAVPSSVGFSFLHNSSLSVMAYDDEYADILGGPILQSPNTGLLGQWSQHSIFFQASLILGLGLLVLLLAVRALDIWKKNQELGYRKCVVCSLFSLLKSPNPDSTRAMRRKHGIPDSDCRPFAVAYAAATRARAEREAQERQNVNKVTVQRPAMDHSVPPSDAHVLRRRAAEPGGWSFFVLCSLQSNQTSRSCQATCLSTSRRKAYHFWL